MADDRRRFLEETIRTCDEKRREQLLLRLEQVEDTGAQGVIPILSSRDDAVFFAKLAFTDENGAWRYGLFDPTRCELRGEEGRPLDAPILVSKKAWRRSHYDPRPPDIERRRRGGH